MYAPSFADVAGPGLLLVTALPFALIGLLLIVPLEAFGLWLLKWARFPRALLAALVANLVSALIGVIFAIVLLIAPDSRWLFVLTAFALSVVIEAFALMLFRRGEARANWIGSFVMNLLSYGLIIAPLYGLLFRNVT